MPAKGVGLDRCHGAPSARRPSFSDAKGQGDGESLKAVLVASGDSLAADVRWLDDAQLVVAVDGGAAWLESIGRTPDLLVGDLDSVDPQLVGRLEAESVPVERHPTAKDSSDCELALAAARTRGADEITVLGAIGGQRLDHELANVLLPAASHAGEQLQIVRGGTRVRALQHSGELAIDAAVGTLVSLLPIGGDAEGVSTDGLRYPLLDEPLHLGSTRGLSNEVDSRPASVRLRQGTLLVIETGEE
jgi:thiamine pyrophosphokinase